MEPGGDLTYNLAATSTGFLTLSGALTKGSGDGGSGFDFNFQDAGDFALAGQTYDLLSFGSTTFA